MGACASTLSSEKRKKQAGFSLLEMAIYLIIVAVLVGSALMVGSTKKGFARDKQTQDKLALLEESLVTFVRLNGRLPCPADGSLARTNAALGDEACVATLVDLGVPPIHDMHVGIIPTSALNLSDEFIFDGYSRRFTYAVDAEFITRSGFTLTDAGELIIVDAATAGVRSNAVVYSIVAHGENGHGAWSQGGGANRFSSGSTDAGEVENADTVTADFDQTFAQGPRSANYDDLVYYKTKQQLLHAAGTVVGSEVCELAQRTLKPVNNPALAPISDATRPKEGAVGCEVEPLGALTTMDEYKAHPRHQDCVNRQIRLAEMVAKRCSK